MRDRLTAAFVLLAVVVLLVAGVARAWALREVLNEQASENLLRDARVIAVLLDGRKGRGEPVDEEVLASLIARDSSVEYRRGDVTLRAEGPDHRPADDDLVRRFTEGDVAVEMRRSAEDLQVVIGRQLTSLVVMLVLLLLLAALGGMLAARVLSGPFRALADVASGLGRGRFEVDLPQSSMPEVVAIGQALRVSASQIEQSVVRDREYVRHASQALRSPVTQLRHDLGELSVRPDVGQDVRDTAAASVAELVRLEEVLGELLRFALDREMVAGSETTVRLVATSVGDRWRSGLAEGAELRVHVDEGPERTLTQGPVEKVLDQVLLDAVATGARSVTLRFSGTEDTIRVLVQASVPLGVNGDTEALVRARVLVESMGGTLIGDQVGGADVVVTLPRG